jgi:hypothetical protein
MDQCKGWVGSRRIPPWLVERGVSHIGHWSDICICGSNKSTRKLLSNLLTIIEFSHYYLLIIVNKNVTCLLWTG